MDRRLTEALLTLPPFTVGVVLFKVVGRRLQVLFKQPKWLKNMDEWMLVDRPFGGGGESLDECALEVVTDFAGSREAKPVALKTANRGGRLPGVMSVYYAAIPHESSRRIGDDDTRYSWFDVSGLPRAAGDDLDFIKQALVHLADNPEQVARLAHDVFTISELHRDIAEIRRLAGLGEGTVKRTLRRQLEDATWLEDTGRLSGGNSHRPAKLYRVKGGS